MSGQVKHTRIPKEFVLEALEHLEQTGKPLLRYRMAEYHTVLEAGSGSDHQLSEAFWRAPFYTWREYARFSKTPLRQLRQEYGLTGDEVDRMLENYEIIDLLEENGYAAATELGRAYAALASVRLPKHFRCEDMDVDLGRVEFTAGSYPGDNSKIVSVTSPVALSCLQYVLDEREIGIQIILASYY